MALAFILAFVSASLITCVLCKRPDILPILDQPNERSLHAVPIPRTGGLAILAGVLIGCSLFVREGYYDATLLWIGAALMPIAVVSFLDDRYDVSAVVRFSTHVVAALILIIADLRLQGLVLPNVFFSLPAWFAVMLSLLFIVWMINLYNFMDGMDGLAAGMAVIGFGTFSFMGFGRDAELFAGVNLVIALAAAGFLAFNFPPARIFMGDAGSSSLGFAAAASALWADRTGLFPLWVSLLIFSPFVVDASVTLVRRLRRRDKIWLPHKTHYYQRLVESGWGHRKTTLLAYVLMLLCALSASFSLSVAPVWQWCVIAVWAMTYSAVLYWVDRHTRWNSIAGKNPKGTS